jgi:hypothetical protein
MLAKAPSRLQSGSLPLSRNLPKTNLSTLVTIAGTLDHARWTHDDGVSPLSRSLNAADVAERLQSLRQIHFVGAKDESVPPAVAESYLARMTDRSRATLVRVPGYSHECCWEEGWRGLLARYVYLPGQG